MEIRAAKPAIVAASGAAIITDNISLVKSRCNWLFETMNSNPRLVTVGGTITSQIHVRDDCQSYIYRKYYPTPSPLLAPAAAPLPRPLPPPPRGDTLTAFIFACAHFYPLFKRYGSPRVRTRDSAGVQFAFNLFYVTV